MHKQNKYHYLMSVAYYMFSDLEIVRNGRKVEQTNLSNEKNKPAGDERLKGNLSLRKVR